MRAFLVLLLAAVAQCRLAPVLRVEPNIPGQYIVVLEDGIDAGDFAANMNSDTVRTTLSGIINAVVVTLDGDLLEKVRGLNGVKYIEEDGLATVLGERNVRNYWNLDRIDQRALPLDNIINIQGEGKDTNIYIIDTGISYTHEDFGGRAKPFYDYQGLQGEDCHGHGTHCAGTAGGMNSGVATEANIYSVRVMSCSGSGSNSAIIEGLNRVAAAGAGNKVASMSIGGGVSSVLDDAVVGAHQKGVVVVAAAGNDNRDACYYSPARAPDAITVGATTSRDKRSVFSNYGSCLDIFAPGSNIRSASYNFDSMYLAMSGTSMACPHVAGAAAVVRGNNRFYSPDQVATKLISDSTKDTISDPGTRSPNRLLFLD